MILFTALLSPAVRALPGWTVGTAGESAWLTGILAFPPFLLLGWMVFSLCRRSGGLTQAYQDAFGPLAGKVVIVIYLSWALFLLCAEGRLYAERMLSAGYRSAAPWVFLLVLLGVVLWMGRRKLGAFARAAEICYLVLALTLGLVLLFSILDMSPEHVLPVWITDVPAVTAATLVPVGVLSCGVFGGFLGGNVTRRSGDARQGLLWLLAGCGVLTLLEFGVLGQLGPALCGRMDIPFFEVARGVGVDGAFQRVESVVVALWVLSDFAMLGLLVFAIRKGAGAVLGSRWEHWAAPVAVIVAFLGGLTLFPDDFSVEKVSSAWVPWGNLILAFPVPALALIVTNVKGRKKTDTSCGEKRGKDTGYG